MTENTESELIIGIWKPTKFVDVDQEGTSNTVETYEGCAESNRWTFNENGGFDKEEFRENGNGNCEQDLESSNIESGTWEKIEGKNFKIFITYKDGGTDTDRPEITFPDKNTMRLSYEGDVPEIDYFYGEYTRVE
ncbi:lipocalin family protein [Maribacter aquivivus]|uniref:lipocalin family protein n=1 Tax=Maribacter aquivivus TaxID=228958 RepID=UPI00249050EF|nr:lipocalin family protein [Maribacter aquivivus]